MFGVHLSFATVFLLFSTFFLLFRRFIFRGHKKMKIKKSNERRKKPAFIRLFATGIAHLSITVSVIILEQMTGIEPAFSAWEADALPLSYICVLFRNTFIISDFPLLVKPCFERFSLFFFLPSAFPILECFCVPIS